MNVPCDVHKDGRSIFPHVCTACGLGNPNPHENYCRSCKAPLGTTREQCSPPVPGDVVYRGDERFLVMGDGRLRAFPKSPQPVPHERADRVADWLFCTSCLRLRISPGHLLVCSDRRRKVITRGR